MNTELANVLMDRDVPSEMPVFVAANCAKDNGIITAKGDNIFAAVRYIHVSFFFQFLLSIRV